MTHIFSFGAFYFLPKHLMNHDTNPQSPEVTPGPNKPDIQTPAPNVPETPTTPTHPEPPTEPEPVGPQVK